MCVYLTGYILSLVLLTLPRQHLVKLYLYVLTALLLFAGHQVSRCIYTHTHTLTYTDPPTQTYIKMIKAVQWGRFVWVVELSYCQFRWLGIIIIVRFGYHILQRYFLCFNAFTHKIYAQLL